LSIRGENAVVVQEKRTTSQTLPVRWSEEKDWNQMVRLIVQAAVEKRSRKFVSLIKARRCYCELLNPRQPSCVFHL
jgi:hypothetical protein